MSPKKEAFFAKRLSFLLSAGVPLTECLRIVGVPEVASVVETGRTLADTLQEARTCSPFTIAVIRIAETSGTLSSNLSYLADELEKGSALRAKTTGALIYPALIALATVGLTAGLILFIFPKILPVFAGLGVTLPWTTRTVLFISSYLTHWGVTTLAILIVFSVGFSFALRRIPRARAFAETLLLRMPVIGVLVQSYYLSNLTRILAILLESGMPLERALIETGEAVRHQVYRTALQTFAERIERGTTLASGMHTPALFPDIVGHMIAVGERSGTLVKSLTYLAEYYGREVDEGTMRLTRLAEPVLMVVMGCIVGFVAISMITPMYEITQHLNAP